MPDSTNLFAEFPKLTKAQWLAKVEKDLKGKPLADLQWQLEENIRLDPFYHLEEVAPVPIPGAHERPHNHWEIGEYIDVKEPKIANQEAKEGLLGGVEAPLFRLLKTTSADDLKQLLEGIEPTFVSLHFSQRYADKKPWDLFYHLLELLRKTGTDLNQVHGSLDFDPILDWTEAPFEHLGQTILECSESIPHFKVLQINARPFHHGIENTSRELTYTIAKGSEYLAKMIDNGLSAMTICRHLQFSVAISTSYFVEIAKLRALRVLWSEVERAYGVDQPKPAMIEAHLAWESLADDAHDNMIRASTQSMSAVIGGIDRLFVWPSNAGRAESSNAFSRRIARNVQHLLKMESYLDRVVDPAAGSYYVEKLTQRLVEEAWRLFQEIEEKGGFMRI